MMNLQTRVTWVLLCLLALGQAWLIYRIEFSEVKNANSSTTSQTTRITDVMQHDAAADYSQILTALQRIEQRLDNDERTQTAQVVGKPYLLPQHEAWTAKVKFDEASKASADQRLNTMLPYGRVSQQQMAAFHAELGSLSPEQRMELSAALARAINEGRIEPVGDGF